MLFATKLSTVSENLVNLTQEINELEQRLELLREQKKQLENFTQQLQSAEAAAESALQQVNTALVMVRAIDDAEVVTFKAAVDSIFALSHSELPETIVKPEDAETLKSATKKLFPESQTEWPDEKVVTVEAEEADEVQLELKVAEAGLTGKYLATTYSHVQLRKLADAMGVKPSGKKKTDYADALSDEGITKDAIEEILNG